MSKATRAQTMLRVREVLRIRLDGAKEWDVSEYVREQEQADGSPWELADGQTPLSDRQIRRYVEKADALIAESTRESRKRSLVKHLAQRANLYAKAVNAGDIRSALAAADSEARLRGLFDMPARAAKVTPVESAADMLQLLASTVADLRAARLDNKTAATLGSLAGAVLRAIEVSDLAERVGALEAAEAQREAQKGSFNGRVR
jgi:hypothetical protein